MKPKFFTTAAAFRAWLERNHADAAELLVGFRKKESGKPSLTWPESVDEALCFGWIDGVRKRLDDESYTIRFSPRRPTSAWSEINLAKVAKLRAGGRMHAAGLAAFSRRRDEKSRTYSYELRRNPEFAAGQRKEFEANARAWEFFRSQAPSYRRLATYWVVSAKRAETQAKRLKKLIAESAAGRRV